MRVLLDTNVILDLLLERGEWLESAFQMETADYEDAVQVASALQHSLDAIITRDTAGFEGISVPVLLPRELIEQL